ncbi:MAG: hypothetical protein RJQ09_21235 [Cyclobacteriaceae bacterium]
MLKTLLRRLGNWLTSLGYEKLTVDKVNSKLIERVDGLSLFYNGKQRQLYKYVNQADMVSAREVWHLAYDQELGIGLSREHLLKYVDKTIAANDKGEVSKIGELMFMLKDTLENCTPNDAIYNLASVMYFDRDEDLKKWDADWNAEKIAAFKNHPDQAFFLTRFFKDLGRQGEQSVTDTLTYLRQSNLKLKAYSRLLSES